MAANVRERTLPSGDIHFQADIRVRLPNGTLYRERVKAPGSTRAQALKWARKRELHIMRHGPKGKETQETEAREVPTFAEFAPRFVQDHIMANRLSPTTKRDYENSIKMHFIPVLGDIHLDRIEARHVQALKRRKLAATTTNKMLNQLKAILGRAVKWGLIDKRPEITGVKEPARNPKFYDFGEYKRLTGAAANISSVTLAGVRLGGDAGLRCGEIIGLRWPNVHLDRGKLYVCENIVNARDNGNRWVVRVPKGGRPRWVPISTPLAKALRALPRHGEYVLMTDDGHHLKPGGLTKRLRTAQKHAGLKPCGPHILRHTFCSHLVLRNVHVRTIQKLAGHAELSTTEVYMHLVSEVEEDAIRRLRDPEDDE